MAGNALSSLLYFLVVGLFFYWMMRKGGCGMHGHGHGGHSHGGGGHPDGGMGGATRDPVCGMTVDPVRAAGTRVVMGRTFYLCSESCLATFDRDPEGYARRAAGSKESPAHHHHMD